MANDSTEESQPAEPEPQDTSQGAAGSGNSTSVSAGVSISADYSRRYGFEASSATKITARIVALPPPSILLRRLGATQAVIDEVKSQRPPPDGGAPARSSPDDELTEADKQWVEFGETWLAAVDVVVEQVEELRQKFVAQNTEEASDNAGMLATLKQLLQRFPDSTDNVENMKTFLQDDQVVDAAETNSLGVTVEIKSPLLAVLDEAPL